MHLLLVTLTLLAAAPKTPAADEPKTGDRREAFYHFSLGIQARLAGDGETALTELRRAQKLDPASAAIHAATAKLLRDLGKGPEALAEAREAVRVDATSVESHMILGDIYQRQASAGDTSQLALAAAEYEAVYQLDPTELDAVLLMASIYGQLEEHKKAAAAWERYAAVVPSTEAYVKIGSHYLAAGDHDAAAKALQKAVDLQPNSARAYQALAEVYDRADQADSAVLYYRKALEIAPSDLRVRLSLGDVLLRGKRLDEALSCLLYTSPSPRDS